MKRIICWLTAWHWLALPLERPKWHSDANRYGRRCQRCGMFERHPWFTDIEAARKPAAEGGGSRE